MGDVCPLTQPLSYNKQFVDESSCLQIVSRFFRVGRGQSVLLSSPAKLMAPCGAHTPPWMSEVSDRLPPDGMSQASVCDCMC